MYDNSLSEGVIYLFEKKEELLKKIKKSKTDNFNQLKYAEIDRKEINNLINLFCFFYYYNNKNWEKKVETDTEINDIFLKKEIQCEKKHEREVVKINENAEDDIISCNYDSISKVNTNDKMSFYRKNNINAKFNAQVINRILSRYNNNYEKFKLDLSLLISEHFLYSNYIYINLISKDDLIKRVLKKGKNILLKRAQNNFRVLIKIKNKQTF